MTSAGRDGVEPSDRYLLRLFVSGQSPSTRRAIANLERVCLDELDGRFHIEVIDVLEHPEIAEQERILGTPTLIKRLPPPMRRVIGDLANTDQVLMGLDLTPFDRSADDGPATEEPR